MSNEAQILASLKYDPETGALTVIKSGPAAGSVDGVISNEVESLLLNIAQILDVVKPEWGEAWSQFDQEQRDHITRLLLAKRPLNAIAMAPATLELESKKDDVAGCPSASC